MFFVAPNFVSKPLVAVPLPTPNPKNIGMIRVDGDDFECGESRIFFAAGPDSSTPYNATVSFYINFDGLGYEVTPTTLVITNVDPVNSVQTFVNGAQMYGASMVINSGTITTVGNTNGRVGVNAGVEAT